MIRSLLPTLFVAAAWPQTSKPPDDPWKPLRYFVGAWDKTEEGRAGDGAGHRDYEFILNNQFLLWRNMSIFPPQAANPKGETHVDWAILSFDKGRNKILLRQFHGEGFVHHYVLEEMAADGKRLVFTSEKIENTPPGWRSRLTMIIVDDNRFEELFELARPGHDFQQYVVNRLKRRK